MKLADAMQGVRRLFLDTAPLIYLVERNPRYVSVVVAVFRSIDEGRVTAVTSPVTLAESLIIPFRLGSAMLKQRYIDQIVHGPHTLFIQVDDNVAVRAAELRARYNLPLPDALQLAVALLSGSDALLTNDTIFERVTEIRALVIDRLEL